MNSAQRWSPRYRFFVIVAVLVPTLWAVGLATLHGHGSTVDQVLHWLAFAIGIVSVFGAARHMLTLPRRPLVSVSYLCLAAGMGALFLRTGNPEGPHSLTWIAEAAIFASVGLNWIQASRTRRNSTPTVG